MNPKKLKTALAAAVNAAREAGQLMRRNLGAAKRVHSATQYDIKLELDVRCQKLIERRLRRVFPAIALLGEEGDSSTQSEEYRWVVDPIDGTVNFAYGIPHACVSIALQKRQVVRRPGRRTAHPSRIPQYTTLIGVVYDPFQRELWTAIAGGRPRLNGRPIRVSRRQKLGECLAAMGFSKSRTSLERGLPYFAWLTRRARKVRMLGAAALGLTYVATGRLDAYIEPRINLWDLAAGVFILERAGGQCWLKPLRGKHKFRMVASNGRLQDPLPLPR